MVRGKNQNLPCQEHLLRTTKTLSQGAVMVRPCTVIHVQYINQHDVLNFMPR